MMLLIAWFGRRGLGERASRLAGYLTVILALTALLGLLWAIWLHRHDRGLVASHEAAIGAAVATASSSAEAAANANDLVRASDRAAADQQLRDAINDATAKDPDAVHRPAGPAVRAVVDGLRRH